MLVVQFVARKLQEGNCTRWTKRYADHAGLFIGIDSKTLVCGPLTLQPLNLLTLFMSSGSYRRVSSSKRLMTRLIQPSGINLSF